MRKAELVINRWIMLARDNAAKYTKLPKALASKDTYEVVVWSEAVSSRLGIGGGRIDDISGGGTLLCILRLPFGVKAASLAVCNDSAEHTASTRVPYMDT